MGGATDAPGARAFGLTRETTPHQTTIQRVLARLDPTEAAAAVQRVFAPVIPGAAPGRGSQGIALDGKAQRGRVRHGATPTHPRGARIAPRSGRRAGALDRRCA
ncbi:MAG: hypothetical protein RMJ55_02120, partial [Roseiflexaceae bacterium]|nr:hypothetical protein [Roseiflexaceae bacterium]